MKCLQCQSENRAGAAMCHACGLAMPHEEQVRHPPAELGNTAQVRRSPQMQNVPTSERSHTDPMLRKRRAISENASARAYITHPSISTRQINQAEKQMNLVLGALFLGVIGTGMVAVYINYPNEDIPYAGSPLTALIDDTLRKHVQKNRVAIHAVHPIGSPLLYSTRVNPALKEVEAALKAAPPAAIPVANAKAALPPVEPALRPVPETPPTEIVKLEEPALPPLQAEEPSPPPVAESEPVLKQAELSPANKVPVIDRSIVSEKPRKRLESGCVLDEKLQDCTPRYVVTLKSKRGKVVEERFYPSREMSKKAQELWHREGKILEPNGKINDRHAQKPKTFTPFPGHSI